MCYRMYPPGYKVAPSVGIAARDSAAPATALK
jgi:hypothetical protein